jgi:mono/diheme cytochrome c family protein
VFTRSLVLPVALALGAGLGVAASGLAVAQLQPQSSPAETGSAQTGSAQTGSAPSGSAPAETASPGAAQAPAGAGQPPFDLADTARVEEGRQQFQQTCAVAYCHGADGRTGGGAPTLRGRKVGTPEQIHAVIVNGRQRMPPWRGRLPEQKLWALVAYVMSLEKEPAQ